VSGWTATSSVDPYIAPQLDRSALLVIDTQVDFLDGGASPIPGTTQVLPMISELLDAFRLEGRPVVHVVRLYQGEDVDLARRALLTSSHDIVRPGSPGSQIAPTLRPEGVMDLDPERLLTGEFQELGALEWAMWKPRWGAFYRTRLEEHLRRQHVTTVVLAGCNYPNCPRATAYGASERDLRVLLAADALSGVLPHHLAEAGRMGVLCTRTHQIIHVLSSHPRGRRPLRDLGTDAGKWLRFTGLE
jgi:nicotinamidase-related amidase